MFLDVHELELHEIVFDETLPPGRLEFGEGIRQLEPLVVRGKAALLELEIHITGSLKTTVETDCDRCLEVTRRPVALNFDLYYEPIKTIARNEEVEISKDDLDIGFYEGHGMMLEDAVKEQVLLALPMKNICRPECKGLCPECGQNWNLGKCSCRRPVDDLHWAPLAKLSPGDGI